jgi:hypothetical protein
MSLSSKDIIERYETALTGAGWTVSDYLLALDDDPGIVFSDKTYSYQILYGKDSEMSGHNWEIPLIIDFIFVFELPLVGTSQRASAYKKIMTTEIESISDVIRNVSIQNPRTIQAKAHLPADNVQDFLFVTLSITIPYCHKSV